MLSFPPACTCQICSPTCQSTTHIICLNLADVRRTRVRNGDQLDQLCFPYRCRLGRSEESLEIDVPMRAQPYQTLNRDDGTAPNKGPFLATNMLIVQVFGEVVTEEDGPYYRKGPDV